MSVYISSPMYLLKHCLFQHIKFVPKVFRSCIIKYIAFSSFSSSKMCCIVHTMLFQENITVSCFQMFLEFATQRLMLCNCPRLRLTRILTYNSMFYNICYCEKLSIYIYSKLTLHCRELKGILIYES